MLKFSGAFFSSSATSKNNALTSGSLTILLSDQDESQKVDISGSWSASGLLPGTLLTEHMITVKNNGNINAHHIDIEFTYTGSQNLARSIIFSSINNGFRFGATSADSRSVNLNTGLRGSTDVDYRVLEGVSGIALTANTVDGADGSVRDSKISLSELAAVGKIRIEPGEENAGIFAGTEATLWLNAEVSPELTEQNATIQVQIKFTLDQDNSQL